ncbi:MAG TPA: CCC motif membrane protein [Flavobacterium sp.]|uniref:CCC motif membrane protein n=1 Tax=Flavobacterium sp. TaxID=239 RepID=UPI002CE93A89|nr:CCC motif membrane protein [Flavobacterium sp.]HSD14026.1 CCC motif membrane protein [Flavobacterium sp.]
MEETNFDNFDVQEKLPNATPAIILGVLSIICCLCYGFGAILGGIGLFLTNRDIKTYNGNPNRYSNLSNVKTGKVLCIIGIVLGLLWLALVIWMISYFGIEAMQDKALMQEKMRELLGE